MKRGGPLQRKTSLRSSGSLSRSSTLSRSPMRESAKTKTKNAKKRRDWSKTRQLVIERDGSCRGREMGGPCGGGAHVHHVKRRSQGGTDELFNLVLLCSDHHEMVHSRIEFARSIGLLA